ncbi:MAG TPA: YceI family protein [Candidatus Margulisiibacteriota bacterium]|nr:YceI family protein [Candidatus Margulisiibacteriota bacterium]
MRRLIVMTAVAVAIGSTAAKAATFEIDPAHTSAQFAVRHLMVSTVRGTLGKVTGTVSLDDADVTKSTVEATIDVAGIETREPKRDAHLKSPDFLDVAKYPTIVFKSKKVTKVADDKYHVTGDLTLHGVTKEVVLDAEGSPKPFTDPFGNAKLGGAVHTKINRQNFGVAWNKALDGGGVVVGDDVDVTIDIELIKKP